MNWMIDGAYGDLYRQAMGYSQLQPLDEWEIERRGKISPSAVQPETAQLSTWIGAWLGNVAGQVRGITAIQYNPERKVS